MKRDVQILVYYKWLHPLYQKGLTKLFFSTIKGFFHWTVTVPWLDLLSWNVQSTYRRFNRNMRQGCLIPKWFNNYFNTFSIVHNSDQLVQNFVSLSHICLIFDCEQSNQPFYCWARTYMSQHMIKNVVSNVGIFKQSWKDLIISWITAADFLFVKFKSILQT